MLISSPGYCMLTSFCFTLLSTVGCDMFVVWQVFSVTCVVTAPMIGYLHAPLNALSHLAPPFLSRDLSASSFCILLSGARVISYHFYVGV